MNRFQDALDFIKSNHNYQPKEDCDWYTDKFQRRLDTLQELIDDYKQQVVIANSYKASFNDLQDKVKKYEDFEDVNQLIDENEKYVKEINKLREELRTCKNELCLYCGRYKQEHMGACAECRWHKC